MTFTALSWRSISAVSVMPLSESFGFVYEFIDLFFICAFDARSCQFLRPCDVAALHSALKKSGACFSYIAISCSTGRRRKYPSTTRGPQLRFSSVIFAERRETCASYRDTPPSWCQFHRNSEPSFVHNKKKK